MRVALPLLACLAAMPMGGVAQQIVDVQATAPNATSPQVQVRSPVLTIDRNRLYYNSVYGRQIRADISAAVQEMNARNDEIAAELEAEERALTEQRPSLSAEEFRSLAEAFDEKSQRIRGERLAAAQALQERQEAERRAFEQELLPVLEQIMIEAGAAVILDVDEVFAASNAIDITDLAIQRVDAVTVSVDKPSEDTQPVE